MFAKVFIKISLLIFLGSLAFFVTSLIITASKANIQKADVASAINIITNNDSDSTSSQSSSSISSSISSSKGPEFPATTKLNTEVYIADFAYKSGVDVLKRNKDKFVTVSPVWFSVDPKQADGLATRSSTNDKDLISFTKKNNIKLIPSIAQFYFEDLSKIFNNKEQLSKHIDSIVNRVVKNNYDGIDLDYENIKEGEKALYEDFVSRLYSKLNEIDKVLVVTVLAKDKVTQNGSPTRINQDWKFLSENSDLIRIMVYDYRSPIKNSYAVTPLFFLEDVIEYAQSVIPNDKISIGLPNYGYRYIDDSNKQAITYKNILTFRKNKSLVSDELDPETSEKKLTYMTDNKTNEAWYTDAEVNKIRTDLIKKMGIKNIFFWRLGDEDEKIYVQ